MDFHDPRFEPRQARKKKKRVFRVKHVVLTRCRCAQSPCACIQQTGALRKPADGSCIEDHCFCHHRSTTQTDRCVKKTRRRFAHWGSRFCHHRPTIRTDRCVKNTRRRFAHWGSRFCHHRPTIRTDRCVKNTRRRFAHWGSHWHIERNVLILKDWIKKKINC